tara:strand:+ start:324 stop:524 length:201 start_codon:yes stop_codon:yes gene_type:complete
MHPAYQIYFNVMFKEGDVSSEDKSNAIYKSGGLNIDTYSINYTFHLNMGCWIYSDYGHLGDGISFA